MARKSLDLLARLICLVGWIMSVAVAFAQMIAPIFGTILALPSPLTRCLACKGRERKQPD